MEGQKPAAAMWNLFFVVVFVLSHVQSGLAVERRYVRASANIGGDGRSWEFPYQYLNEALDDAQRDRNITEIWVAGGVYYPNYGYPDREGAFALVPGVAVYGGFIGYETHLTPPWERVSESILSGDIGVQGDSSDNNYSVVLLSPGYSGCMLDNFTIEGGNGTWGGGIQFTLFNDHTRISNCTFRDNYARWGGAMFVGDCIDAQVINCVFEGNSAGSGGAAYCSGQGSRMGFTNTLFAHNDAGGGGALVVNSGPLPIIRNCTFAQNVATDGDGGAIYLGTESVTEVANSIFSENSPSHFYEEVAETLLISYSCIQYGWKWEDIDGNIADDPRFVSPTSGDFHLSPNSDCIDAGDNRALPWKLPFDLDLNRRVLDDPRTDDTGRRSQRRPDAIVDMGCYEFQP